MANRLPSLSLNDFIFKMPFIYIKNIKSNYLLIINNYLLLKFWGEFNTIYSQKDQTNNRFITK